MARRQVIREWFLIRPPDYFTLSMIKLLKIDIIHPLPWLHEQKQRLPGIATLTLAEYRNWLLGLKSNYSDFYTYPLNETKEWQAEEYFLADPDYTRKVAEHLWGKPAARLKEYAMRGSGRLREQPGRWPRYVLDQYIRAFAPHVLFVRSHPLPSTFWLPYRPTTLLVSRLSARLPFHWHPNHWDLLYTDLPDFQHFFELHGVPTVLNDQGFDARILAELRDNPPARGVVFVGGMGTENFARRTEFFERLAVKIPFRWWGYWWTHGGDGRRLADFPALAASYQGYTSGTAMFQLYRDAAICLNDYVDIANGIGTNQRMYEVMGVGGFLLTRQAPNFADQFPPDIFATYTDEADCLRQIAHYTQNSEERRAIARRGQAFVLAHHEYRHIALSFGEDVKRRLRERNLLPETA